MRNGSEEMNCESHLVDSMMTKLFIPRNDSYDGNTETNHHPIDDRHSPQRFVTCGKRRFNTKVDDTYDGLKQRQRLGSAEAAFPKIKEDTGESGIIVKETTELAGFIPMSSFNSDQNQWPAINPPHLIWRSKGNESFWNKIDFSSFSSSTPRSPIMPLVPVSDPVKLEKCSTIEKNDECDSYFYNPLTSDVKSMDIQSEARNQSNDIRMCSTCRKTNSDEQEKEMMELYERCRLEPCAEIDGKAAMLSASDWRDSQMENLDIDQQMPVTNARADDSKGTRAFRRYKKVIVKSGSKTSDLMNRVSSSSETMKASLARNSSDLDVFFSEMGMEKSTVTSGMATDVGQLDYTHSSTSLNILENISSIGTPLDSRSCTSHESYHHMDDSLLRSLDLEEKPVLSMSVVERNARIIKWLCSMRKVPNLADDIDV